MKHRVFISHSSKDKTIGDEICRFLEGNGIPCWIAPRDVMPGKNYGAAIVDAIDECAVFLLVLTSESNRSGQVVREVERAASSDSVIIPLLVDAVQPSRNLQFYVSSSHWLDATEKPLAKHLGKLLEAIKNWEAGEQPVWEQTHPAGPVSPHDAAKRRVNPLLVAAIAIPGLVLCALAAYFIFGQAPSSPEQQVASAAVAPESTSTPAATSPPPTEPEPPVVPPAPAVAEAPTIQQITASSVLAPETHRGEMRRFDETLAFDDDITTAWVPTTNGIDQWIKVDFKAPVSVASVLIYGGYGVDARRYEANNRARNVRVTFSDGTSEVLQLEDKMKLQRFELSAPVTTDSVKIEILALYKGERHDETPISEIAFNRDEN